MEKKPRLTGIDLFRGIAIYAVVILHSDEGIVVKPPVWTAISQFSGFAVPFFLATAFYLTTERIYVSDRPYNLKARLIRLLIPYGIWSIIYSLYKILKYTVKNDFDKLFSIFQDPVSIILFGDAAFHLYFLPLLVSGTILLKLTEGLIKRRTASKYLFILCALSLIIYQYLLGDNDGLTLNLNLFLPGVIDQDFLDNNPAVKIILIELYWAVRCLPYIFLAMILNHQNIKKKWLEFTKKYVIVCCTGFLVLNIYGGLIMPGAIYEVIRGYGALLVAIAISTKLKENAIVNNLSACSFGIYLLHLLVVEVLQSLQNKLYGDKEPISAIVLVAFSIIIFLISWALVFYLNKQKSIAKLLFGA